MTINDTNLVEAFGCAGRVGINGMPTETQAYSLVNSVSPEQLGAGGCNEGFLRDDALLADAVTRGASDIHFEPEQSFVRIR